jgi:signal peptidase II
MSPSLRRWLLLFAVIGLVLALDQLSKQIVIRNLLIGQTVPVLAPLFSITYSENTGAAFGFLPQSGDIFLIFAVVIITALLIFYPRIPADDWLTRIGIALVCGGALGNAIDRLSHGAVIDFVHLQIPGVISNVSNFADHAIVLGVFLILIQSWRADSRKKKEANLTPQPPLHNGEGESTDLPSK